LSAEQPVRLLLVTDQFGQGGSERYLFELCAALDRARFQIEILTRTGVDRKGFYYPRIRALGVPIHAIRPHVPELRSLVPAVAARPSYRRLHHRMSSALARRRIGAFLDSFDVVSCIQIENYLNLQFAFRVDQPIVIHAMSNRFQYAYDPYDQFGEDREYRFVAWNSRQVEEMARLRCARIFEWPLSMNFRDYPALAPVVRERRPAKIGIFTRLSREKPLEPLFEAFARVRTRIDATLHVFGRGRTSMYDDALRALGVTDAVFFEGHRENMIDTVRRESLAMCWLMSLDSLLGYASLELAACAMPMVFWNYGTSDTASIRAQTGGAVNAFNSVHEFADFALASLQDAGTLAALGGRLREFVVTRHDISRNIGALEEYYLGVVEESRRRSKEHV
jgi:glycosyltransferase involved in cell wall biosynthesis